MTANQLALASLRESTRHNTAGEQETVRHNTEDENINKERNRLDELSITLTDERERQKNQFQKDYNDAYIAYLNASQEEKEWYDWKMTNLKDAENAYEAKYKEDMTNIQSQLASLEQQKVANDKEYKDAWKQVQFLNAELENKRIEYQQTLGREQIESNEYIKRQEFLLTEFRDTANYIQNMEKVHQGWRDLEQAQQQLLLDKQRVEAQSKLMEQQTKESRSKTFSNYWNSVWQSVKDTADAGFRAFDLYLKGGKYGTAKKAAEALFSD